MAIKPALTIIPAPAAKLHYKQLPEAVQWQKVLTSVMPLLPKFSFNFPLYALCIGIIAITALAAGLTYWLLDQNQRNWSLEYGQALANLSAHRALDSTLNHDLVSLQVILSDVAENPSVINATIHDVENNLLVQAGRRTNPGVENTTGNFSAPITLHNSIAGYVTITLDLDGQNPFAGQMMWLFGLLGSTLIALTLCFGYLGRAKAINEGKSAVSIPIIKSPSVIAGTENDEEIDDEEPSNVSQHKTRLMLCLQNYQELSRQLNSSTFRDINQRLEQHLLGVLALYSGKVVHIESQTVHLQFQSSESDGDAAFNGLCAALLLLKLNQLPTDIPLHIAALLHEDSHSTQVLKRLPYVLTELDDYKSLLNQTPENSLYAQAQLLEDQHLAQRFIQDETAEVDLVKITALQSSYQNLLEKQLQQLSKV